MRFVVKIFTVFVLFPFLAIASIYPSIAQEERVIARIGIQIRSGGQIARAKSNDRLKTGDLFRVYVYPEETSYVYVVHTDGKEAKLLNIAEQKAQSLVTVLPSFQRYYQVDGKSLKETITIIISPNELPEVIDALENGKILCSKWVEIEEELQGKGSIDLSETIEKPISLSGTVRGEPNECDVDPFIEDLQTYSGKSILFKKYEFSVKK
ncbi:MAG: hypothetical protein JXI43_02150 [Tissierellales bacterium]|nr:hypothetical protein [Tissierellales bacterium]